MFKRIFLLGIFIFAAAVLTGCNHDQKQAKAIFDKLENAAVIEQNTADIQHNLNNAIQKEQAAYEEILSLDIADFDKAASKLETAKEWNRKQKELLNKSDETFQNAYDTATSILKEVQKLDEKQQQITGEKLQKLIKKRHSIYTKVTKKYTETIELNDQIYSELKAKKFNADKLDSQIAAVNKKYKDMNKLMDAFSHYTKKYNTVKNSYYKDAGLI